MNESSKNKFLIDGFPRNKNNLDGWNNLMTGKVNVMGVLFFDCPEDVRETLIKLLNLWFLLKTLSRQRHLLVKQKKVLQQ